MKYHLGFCVLITMVLLFVGTVVNAVPSALAAPLSAVPSRSICANDKITPGWILIAIGTDHSHCGGNFFTQNNVWIIAPPPTAQTTICQQSPFPDGFVVVAESLNFPCNSLTIAPVGGIDTFQDVCGSRPLPVDFVITSEYRPQDRPSAFVPCPLSFASALAGAQAFAAETILPVPSDPALSTAPNLQICADSPVPASYLAFQPGATPPIVTINRASCPGAMLIIIPRMAL